MKARSVVPPETRIGLHAAGLTIGANPPPLLLVTVAVAAELAGVTPHTIRNWHRRSSIGAVDRASGVFLVDLDQLAAALQRRFGQLPYGLQTTIFRRGKIDRPIFG